MNTQNYDPSIEIISELQLPANGVKEVIKLLGEGNTVPFLARYRKEVTGNLDEVQIRAIQERLGYFSELNERKITILSSIDSQGKLTEELKSLINNCKIKTVLEDIYLPYKPKRRTRAMIAREKGLEPLAILILEQPTFIAADAIKAFIDIEKNVPDADAALAGARDIVSEMLSENIEIRALVREIFEKEAIIVSKVVDEQNKTPTKFEQYYDYKEQAAKIPSHRYLAIRRGEKEGILSVSFELDQESIFFQMRKIAKLNTISPYAQQLELAIKDAYKRLIAPSVETDLRVNLKMDADRAAVDVFASNLKNLLLASPLGPKTVIGIDPGLRTGCKCAAVAETGKYLGTVTIYPSQGESQSSRAETELLQFIMAHQPYAIGIGNGTAGRETEAFVRSLLKKSELHNKIIVVPVSEAGASVYSASDIAREEFPDLDLTIRGAISIARRLQDPLAELVKVDPKAIGVGQYQHDVFQTLLQGKLEEVIETCVNRVGVELNTASGPLLSRVAGIGPLLAFKIVKHRESRGAFRSRKQLLEVAGLGPRTFEQSAGFLRINGGEHPLDSSAVHPESYALVEQMAKDLNISVAELLANPSAVQNIKIKNYISNKVGELTLNDIIEELKKPGRDPRATFEPPNFREDVSTMAHLKVGMKLDGIVTNVTAFGAFVDIGVHQDGLIHISELTDKFIKDPAEVVNAGDKIKTEVLSVDIERKRISLTARIGCQPRSIPNINPNNPKRSTEQSPKTKKTFNNNPFGSL